MTGANYQVRRATLDDLVPLRRLWQHAGLPVAELEKRITEVQVIETPDGELLGGVALQLQAPHGRIHSLALRSADNEPELRSRLWDRLQALARNHGLARLWTVASGAMAWKGLGFVPATPDVVEKLPPAFGDPAASWLSLKLRDDAASVISLDKEFELFKQTQQALTEKAFRQARALKVLAAVIAVAVLALVLLASWYLYQRLPAMKR